MNISEKCTYKQTLDDVSELVNFIITLQWIISQKK
jgi:hypothetical protein